MPPSIPEEMNLLGWYIFAFTLLGVWWAAAWVLAKHRSEALEKRHIAFQGPFVLWKTQRGKDIIEWASKKRAAVTLYGRVATGITGVAMVTMTVTLVVVAFLVFKIPDRRTLDPHLLLGLPGVNPLIPLWYGIFGLAIAIVVHEFSHGILARLADIKVKSLGLVFFVIPMGAFVEPDEEEIKTTEKVNRVRMFAAGPASNIIVAAICALIFTGLLMSSISIQHEGAGVVNVTGDIDTGQSNITFTSPAQNLSLQEGDIIISLNNSQILDRNDLNRALNQTRPNQSVNISYYRDGGIIDTTVNLTYKGYYWQSLYNAYSGDLNYSEYVMARTYGGAWEYSWDNWTLCRDWYLDKGFLGIGSITVTAADYDPFETQGDQSTIQSFVIYVTLPLTQKSPITETTSQFYEVGGIWGWMPTGAFWIMTNAFYWVFWLNLMVGLTNALPAVPLDGGYIYMDWLDSLKRKVKPVPEGDDEAAKKHDRFIDTIVIGTAFFILFLILWQIIGPRIL